MRFLGVPTMPATGAVADRSLPGTRRSLEIRSM
jgi:hypothetical protein